MKCTVNIVGLAGLVLVLAFTFNVFAQSPQTDDWKNYYAIAWRDTPANSVKYAKQMGYEYMFIGKGSTVNTYKSNPTYAGMNYYVAEPYHALFSFLFSTLPNKDDSVPSKTISYPVTIDVRLKGFIYTQAQQDWYSKCMTWKNTTSPWPYQLAGGGNPYPYDPAFFQPVWDFQQQAVIDEVVNGIISGFASYEAKPTDSGYPFSFAGYIFDLNSTAAAMDTFKTFIKNNNKPLFISYRGSDTDYLINSINTIKNEPLIGNKVIGAIWNFESMADTPGFLTTTAVENMLTQVYQAAQKNDFYFGLAIMPGVRTNLQNSNLDLTKVGNFSDFIMPLMYVQWLNITDFTAERNWVSGHLSRERAAINNNNFLITPLIAITTRGFPISVSSPKTLAPNEISSVYQNNSSTGFVFNGFAAWGLTGLTQNHIDEIKQVWPSASLPSISLTATTGADSN